MFNFKNITTGIYIGRDRVSFLQAEKQKVGQFLITNCKTSDSMNVLDSNEIRNRLIPWIRASSENCKKIALSLPDTFARTIILELDDLPDKRDEASSIIRWQAARRLNQNLDDSNIDYQVLSHAEKVIILLVSVKKDIVCAYEDAFFEAGLDLYRINIHSFNLLKILQSKAQGEADFSVITRMEDYFSIMFFKNGIMDFYRCKTISEREEDIGKEINTSFLSYGDKNPESSISKSYLFSDDKALEEVIKKEIQIPIETINPEPVLRFSEFFRSNGAGLVSILTAFEAATDI